MAKESCKGVIRNALLKTSVRGVGRIFREERIQWKITWFVAVLLFQISATIFCTKAIIKYFSYPADVFEITDEDYDAPLPVLAICPHEHDPHDLDDHLRRTKNQTFDQYFAIMKNQTSYFTRHESQTTLKWLIIRSYFTNHTQPITDYRIAACNTYPYTPGGTLKRRRCKKSEKTWNHNCELVKIAQSDTKVATKGLYVRLYHGKPMNHGMYYSLLPSSIFPIKSSLYSHWKTILPGQAAAININVRVLDNLPPPYGKCEKNIDTKKCMHLCLWKKAVSKCKCITHSIEIPDEDMVGYENYSVCSDTSQNISLVAFQTSCIYKIIFSEDLKYKCKAQCPDNCHSVQYSATYAYDGYIHAINYLPKIYHFYTGSLKKEDYVHKFDEVRQLAELYKNDSWNPDDHSDILSVVRHKLNSHFAFLRFTQEQVNVRYYKMKPGFDVSMLMSTIGGTLSLWGGVTVVVVVEFIQMMFQILASASRSLREKRKDLEPLQSTENDQTKL